MLISASAIKKTINLLYIITANIDDLHYNIYNLALNCAFIKRAFHLKLLNK